MVLTTPGEYVGPMVRTGWLQFPIVPGYTTLRLQCIPQLVAPPTLGSEMRLVQCNVLSQASALCTLTVQQTLSDQTMVRAKAIVGSTTTVIKTNQTGLVSMTGATVRVGRNSPSSIASNTATDITLSAPLPAAPTVGTTIMVWHPRLAVTLFPAPATVQPNGFTRFTFSPLQPIIEFYSTAGKDVVRIQLESNMRFGILPFGKEDPFYPQFITGPVASPWPVPFGP